MPAAEAAATDAEVTAVCSNATAPASPASARANAAQAMIAMDSPSADTVADAYAGLRGRS